MIIDEILIGFVISMAFNLICFAYENMIYEI